LFPIAHFHEFNSAHVAVKFACSHLKLSSQPFFLELPFSQQATFSGRAENTILACVQARITYLFFIQILNISECRADGLKETRRGAENHLLFI